MRFFKQWTRQFVKEGTAIGDLARELRFDTKFPKTQNYYLMLSYLRAKNTRPEVILTYREAYTLYMADDDCWNSKSCD